MVPWPTSSSSGNNKYFMELIQEDSRVDYALKMGLAKNKNRLSYYRKAVSDPRKAVSDPVLRPYVADLLEELCKMAFTDPAMWARMKTILLKKSQLREETEPEQEETPKTLDTLRRVLRERTNG